MTGFSLETFIAEAREAAAAPDPVTTIDALFARRFADPASLAAAMPDFAEDEVLLHEDATVSIWHERFLPTEILPPHNHAVPAAIGVYAGRERNVLYRQGGPKGLTRCGALDLGPGDTYLFGATDMHTVQALDGEPSLGLHVYLGPLTQAERHLYEWDSLRPLPMTGTDFDALKRTVAP